jgi:hypothetical protein
MKWLCGRPRLPADPVLLCVVVGGHGRSKLSHFPEIELYLAQNSVSTVILNADKQKRVNTMMTQNTLSQKLTVIVV